jgi:hypothetical protein
MKRLTRKETGQNYSELNGSGVPINTPLASEIFAKNLGRKESKCARAFYAVDACRRKVK